ncbi:MAG: hypothetical protein AAFR16_00235 [Pseudomonadota bacterium]
MTLNECCATCRFWAGPHQDAAPAAEQLQSVAACRRYPPTRAMNMGEPYLHATTLGANWCGEYSVAPALTAKQKQIEKK